MMASDLHEAERIMQRLFTLSQRRSADINHSEQERGGGEGRSTSPKEQRAPLINVNDLFLQRAFALRIARPRQSRFRLVYELVVSFSA